MAKLMAMGSSLTPRAPCMRANGLTTSNTDMEARAGTIIKSNTQASLSMAKSQETVALNSKAAITKAIL
jgi:hypothetical protein